MTLANRKISGIQLSVFALRPRSLAISGSATVIVEIGRALPKVNNDIMATTARESRVDLSWVGGSDVGLWLGESIRSNSRNDGWIVSLIITEQTKKTRSIEQVS
mgnify:CR=1 FL=1